jgi:hypothetical protein
LESKRVGSASKPTENTPHPLAPAGTLAANLSKN